MKRRSKAKRAAASGSDEYTGGGELDASLQAETRRRYLNYALSVITSRALPDVRDGLKPVQRRILYAMQNDLKLTPDAKFKKSATVVGAVIGRYHPHGDTAIYDAMVRMAQDFSLRLPLVDGSGNFGSLDGDSPAAYRYTEARLAPAAMELLAEIKQDTVPFRANFDATAEEPVVLPARFPNLLVNGSTGIAVGMATNIPPHNLREVVNALIALADDDSLTTTNLLRYIKGPDFPTGGQILNSKTELRELYEQGRGAIRLRGQYKLEQEKRTHRIIVTSIPYGVTKTTVVERIAEVIVKRKLPQLVDVRDESTTDIRVVLEIKRDADPDMVMAYLFKHTPLQLNFNLNLTALVPSSSEVGQPALLSVKEVLQHFLDFRLEVTERRFQYELAALQRRIHILEGFVVIFDALDEAIRIIRASDGRQDAAKKLMKRFGIDEEQVAAILDLRLYRLAKLEINVIRAELTQKRREANKIKAILKSQPKLWGVVKTELAEVSERLGEPRRTKTGGAAAAAEFEFDADAYIVAEDAHVVLTRDGWVKRLREVKDPNSTRVREGDKVMAVLAGSTKSCVAFFTNYGSAYVTKINDVPPTSGYGDPIQKLFKFKDGERIVSALAFDSRALPPVELLAVSTNGYGQRFLAEPFTQPTTRAGRRFAKLISGDEIVAVTGCSDSEVVVTATSKGYVLACRADDINTLEKPGKGVIVIKIGEGDRVIGFIASKSRGDSLSVRTTKGTRQFDLHADVRRLASRGGKGQQIVKRSTLELVTPPVTVPVLANTDGTKEIH